MQYTFEISPYIFADKNKVLTEEALKGLYEQLKDKDRKIPIYGKDKYDFIKGEIVGVNYQEKRMGLSGFTGYNDTETKIEEIDIVSLSLISEPSILVTIEINEEILND